MHGPARTVVQAGEVGGDLRHAQGTDGGGTGHRDCGEIVNVESGWMLRSGWQLSAGCPSEWDLPAWMTCCTVMVWRGCSGLLL